jgi:hypothetical protein
LATLGKHPSESIIRYYLSHYFSMPRNNQGSNPLPAFQFNLILCKPKIYFSLLPLPVILGLHKECINLEQTFVGLTSTDDVAKNKDFNEDVNIRRGLENQGFLLIFIKDKLL